MAKSLYFSPYFNLSNLFRFNYLILLVFILKCCLITSNSSKSKESSTENISYLKNSRNVLVQSQNTEYLKSVLESLNNSTDLPRAHQFLEQIYGKIANDELTRTEQLSQMSSWLNNEDNSKIVNQSSYLKDAVDTYLRKLNDNSNIGDFATAEALKAEQKTKISSLNPKPNESQTHILKREDEDKEDVGIPSLEHNEEDNSPAGTPKSPPCAHYGRYYCSYKEDYPIKVVTEVTKYYKWPLEKLFRDIRHQVMPTLANDNSGGLVCDSITRIVRPGWAKNTNNRWLVVINTDHYQQYVTEVICRHGTGSYCNFIPPCYHSSCRQRYNTQKLLVIDPWNPYKGPFLSEFLFPSCCVCYIPGDNNESTHQSTPSKLTGAQNNPQTYSSPSATVSSNDKSVKVS